VLGDSPGVLRPGPVSMQCGMLTENSIQP